MARPAIIAPFAIRPDGLVLGLGASGAGFGGRGLYATIQGFLSETDDRRAGRRKEMIRVDGVDVTIPGLEGFPFPRMVEVEQSFPRDRVGDVAKAVTDRFEAAALPALRRKRICITAGSRGVPNVVDILAATVRFLKREGAEPFVIPAMGSHGGGTAEGQAAVLEHQGITEDSVGCPIRSSMEVVPVAKLSDGTSLYCDRLAQESDGIVVFNKIKAHSGFRGDWESGIVKMIVIGLGKRHGADMVHSRNILNFSTIIPEAARALMAKVPVMCGLGVTENAYGEIATVDVLKPDEIFPREKEILTASRALLGRLLLPSVDVLIVDAIGKNYSGAGMDPNVTGRTATGHPGFESIPIGKVIVRGLSGESGGNANGIGAADYTTIRCVHSLDLTSTYTNAITSRITPSVKLPMILNNDREAIVTAANAAFGVAPEAVRFVRIPNTKYLHRIRVSESVLPDIADCRDIAIVGEPVPMAFDDDGYLVD